MNAKQGDRCRLCFAIGYFHLNLFATTQKAIEAIQEIFHCEVNTSNNLIRLRLICRLFILFYRFRRMIRFQTISVWIVGLS